MLLKTATSHRLYFTALADRT